MKEGPSGSEIRSRSQATASCCGQKPWWCWPRTAIGGLAGAERWRPIFVLQRDDILADDAAVAPKFWQVVALGENPGELHRALAARAAGSVEFVVFIRHGQRAMLMKPQVKKGRSGGRPRPAHPSVASQHRRHTSPTTGPPVFGLGFPGRPQKRGSVVRLLILNFLPAAAVAIPRPATIG